MVEVIIMYPNINGHYRGIGLRLTASSTRHFCNEEVFSRCLETKCVTLAWLNLCITNSYKDWSERIYPALRSQSK